MGEEGDRRTSVLLANKEGGLLERVGFYGLILFAFGSALSITLAQASFYGFVLLPWLVGVVITGRLTFPKSRVVYAALALLAAYLIATGFGINPVASLKYLKKLGMFFILFLTPLLVTSKRRVHLLISLVILGMTANAVYGITEWLVKVRYGVGRLSVGGTFAFYVTFGGVLVISSLLTYGRVWLDSPLKHRLVYAAAFALQVFALFLTRQRNALVGLVVGLLFFTMFTRRKYLSLLILVVIGGSLLLPHPMKDKVFRTRLSQKVVKSRLDMWNWSIPLIGRHPVTGVGPANVKEAFREEVPGFEMCFRHVHNNYLQILLELGLIGFGAFLWMFWEGLRGTLRNHFKYRQSDGFVSLTSLSAGAAIAGYLAAGLFEFNFGDSEVTMPIWLLLGVIVAIEKGLRDPGTIG